MIQIAAENGTSLGYFPVNVLPLSADASPA